MTNQEALILIDSITKSNYKPTIGEKNFIISLGSQCRTPQRITKKQWEWVQAIYRQSQGAYSKRFSRIERVR